ncbi:nucleotidyltransferase [Vicingus serpentipes]|uniref:Nucleotidyltransferase n=1 Tax=Vicingus serpentipes TaxID=1926625 RepID=A0A5C6RR13_9FLAO|nr:sugar phosphate nucleotidyltransferase [Vicingus serpentipes]TXB64693.1 nucleotidyltransferase [Vicingus serpentipes]
MKIIVPMAGRGSRLRPHTLTVPKPLVPVAGKPIVQRLVEDITKVCGEPVDEIAFIIGDFGDQVEKDLIAVAEGLGAKGSIYHQEEALGTAHAILCAKDSLQGNVVVAFADTLFRADFTLDSSADGIIWVNQIDDPSAFGVVKLNEQNVITDFVEKPVEFVSDLAIIGIYYFKDGAYLKNELQYLIDNDIKEKGEYQLTNALENMKQKGTKFVPGKVNEWLDCGNYKATVYTNQRVLEHIKNENIVDASLKNEGSKIIEPCFIGKNVVLKNATIGPHVSIGDNSMIENSTITNTIIQTNTTITDSTLNNSMIGNFVKISNNAQELSIGDYNEIN